MLPPLLYSWRGVAVGGMNDSHENRESVSNNTPMTEGRSWGQILSGNQMPGIQDYICLVYIIIWYIWLSGIHDCKVLMIFLITWLSDILCCLVYIVVWYAILYTIYDCEVCIIAWYTWYPCTRCVQWHECLFSMIVAHNWLPIIYGCLVSD